MADQITIPKGWKMTTLGEVAEKIGDGLHGTPEYSNNGEYFFVNGNNIENGKITIKPETLKVGRKEFEKYKKDLGENTILLSINGTIGNLAKYRNEKCILGKSAAYININSEDSRDFAYYLMLDARFQRDISKNANGSTIKNVSLAQLREYSFIAPQFSEQRAIAAVLSSLDDKIELLREQNKTLEATAQAIFKEWFVNFNFPNAEGKPYKFSGGKMIDSELGKIPEGPACALHLSAVPTAQVDADRWRVGKLGDIIELYDSKRIPLASDVRAKRKGQYPYYGATSIMDNIDDYLFDGTYLLLAEDGSVIDSKGHPVLQYVWGKFWVSNHTHVIQGQNGFSTEMLQVLLRNTNITGIVNGAVQLKINQANLLSFEILIPTKEILVSFDSILQLIFQKIRNITSQIQALSKLRDTLLPKLMKGEVRVKGFKD